MKTCTNGLPCPTSLQCNIGCYFNEADLHYSRTMHAPIHTRNGGNIITNGAALKPLYDGDDVIERQLASRMRLALLAFGVLCLVALGVLIVRIV